MKILKCFKALDNVLQNKYYELCGPLLVNRCRLWILKYNVPRNDTIVYTKYWLQILFKFYKLIPSAQSAFSIIRSESAILYIKKNGDIYFGKIKA